MDASRGPCRGSYSRSSSNQIIDRSRAMVGACSTEASLPTASRPSIGLHRAASPAGHDAPPLSCRY